MTNLGYNLTGDNTFPLSLRKKYVKNCQIRHTYGEEEEEEEAGISEGEALLMVQNAVRGGIPDGCRTVPEISANDIAAAPKTLLLL